jgi:hypothetical protein
MGTKVTKTEHCGAKHGQGAFWGPKAVAKQKSKRKRRENWKREIRSETDRLGRE